MPAPNKKEAGLLAHLERHAPSQTTRRYSCSGPAPSCAERAPPGWLERGVAPALKAVFLPAGYPHSVSKDYYDYQFWDTLQAFASSISGSLATKVNNLTFHQRT